MIVKDKRLLSINIAFLTLGVVIGGNLRPAAPPPVSQESDVGVVFNSRARAEEMRRTGELTVDSITEACRDSAENYVRHGRIGSAGSVEIVLPSREDLQAVRRFPLAKGLANTPN